MRFLILVSALIFSTQLWAQRKSLYDFSALTIEGETYNFSKLKGKKVLIVNTASNCALTGQYKKLQALYDQFGGNDFEIIGFPANNFKNQEPGSNKEISEFCETHYGVTFQMMQKISVKGEDIHPIYKWLTSKKENGVLNTSVKWNFQKFMIDENGNVLDYASPITSPTSNKIVKWLKE